MIAHALDSLLNRSLAAPDASAWPAGTRMVDTRVGRLRVLDTGGKGPVLLMAPDGPNVIEHHAAVIGLLRAHARVVCFDLPGFGQSKPPLSYRHRLQDGAGAVLAVMDALDIREAALHFSCANGLYAIAAAKAAPQRIRRLLLCQTPSMPAMRAWTQKNVPKPLQVPVLGQLLMRASRRRFAQVWYGIALPDRSRFDEFLAPADHALTHGGCFCLAGVVQGLSAARDAELEGVKTPTLLVWGERDRSHRRTSPDSLQELLPQARVERFADCGHFPDLEQPQRYAELALATINA
jgi:pimeloyl-ACP methyl ester carboxylesterase